MAVPLFVLALLWERFDLGRRVWLRGRAVRLGRFELHTTSLLSGLFFIGLGVLFLVYDGTTALPGLLGVDASFEVEQWARSLGERVPDGVLLGAVVLVVLLVLGARALRRRDPDVPAEPTEEAGQTGKTGETAETTETAETGETGKAGAAGKA